MTYSSACPQGALSPPDCTLQVADYGYVIEDGRIVFDGSPEKLLSHGDIMEFYLGGDATEGERRSYRDVKQYRRKRRWWG